MVRLKRIKPKQFKYKGFTGECYFDVPTDKYVGKILNIRTFVPFTGKEQWDAEIAFRKAVDNYIQS